MVSTYRIKFRKDSKKRFFLKYRENTPYYPKTKNFRKFVMAFLFPDNKDFGRITQF